MGPLVAVVSVMFDGTQTRQMLPASAAVWALRFDPDNGRRWYRRWIEWGSVDSGQWR